MAATIDVISKEKPIQLKVLCILAFTFAGFILAYSILNLLTDIWQNGNIEGLRVEMFPEGLREMAAQILSIIGFVTAVFIFAGIVQIWNRKKNGFWVFSVSIFLFLIIPFITIEVPFYWLFRVQFVFILLAGFFILLFGFNQKHMDKHSGH